MRVNSSIRHVAVEGLNDPIAVRPHLAIVVEMDAVRVGIAGVIEPVAPAMFAPVGRLQQFVNQLVVSFRRAVGREAFHQVGLGRQPREIEADAAGQRPGIGRRGRLQTGCFELRQYEPVDRIADPSAVLHFRQFGSLRGDESPVQLILGPLGHPAPQESLSVRPSAPCAKTGAALSHPDRTTRCGESSRCRPAPRGQSPPFRSPCPADPNADRLAARHCPGRGRRSTYRPGSAGRRDCTAASPGR